MDLQITAIAWDVALVLWGIEKESQLICNVIKCIMGKTLCVRHSLFDFFIFQNKLLKRNFSICQTHSHVQVRDILNSKIISHRIITCIARVNTKYIFKRTLLLSHRGSISRPVSFVSLHFKVLISKTLCDTLLQ